MHSGRVRAGYRVGEALFGGRADRCAIVHVIGERPGTGHNTMSAYVTAADGGTWALPGAVDHDITRVISGIAHTAFAPSQAAEQVADVLSAFAFR
jgi:ethanolamine ammonia-lyase large subunit